MFKLPENLLLGVATAATQIEGGDTNNSWYEWATIPGHIKDGTSPLRGNDHYNRVEQDIALMASMNIQIYRFGIEWSRIEPEEGVFDEKAIAHYRHELEILKRYKIKPLVTLHHFSNPVWFEKQGAFENPLSPMKFLTFVSYTANALADLVDEWITINEPNIYAVNGYFFGTWPPGRKNDFRALKKVYANLAASHIASYLEIHRIRQERGFLPLSTKVGFANHLHVFSPLYKWNPLHRFSVKCMDTAFQDAITRAAMTGISRFPVKALPKKVGNISIVPGRYYDFIGINYYSRGAVSFLKDGLYPRVPLNDLNWEIYASGITEMAKRMYDEYLAPIYITENGTCDNTDSFRSRYIYDHLKQIVDSGLPIERYYHWTFMDNFEWAEGESACFGLVKVAYETQERTVRASGEFYSKIIEKKGVDQALFNEYVAHTSYNFEKR